MNFMKQHSFGWAIALSVVLSACGGASDNTGANNSSIESSASNPTMPSGDASNPAQGNPVTQTPTPQITPVSVPESSPISTPTVTPVVPIVEATPVPTLAPEPSATPLPSPAPEPEPSPLVESPEAAEDCTNVYVAGQSYEAGEWVANNSLLFRCEIAGWCSSESGAWAYEPGVGEHWQVAWTQISACADGATPESMPIPTPTFSPEPTQTPAPTQMPLPSASPTPSPTSAPTQTPTPTPTASPSPDDASQGDHKNVVATYFVEWSVYGRNYHVADMPAEKLTHVIYGFIPICGPNDSLAAANAAGYSALVSQCEGKEDYTVVIHDKFAAVEKSYPGDSWDNPIRGNFGQLIKLKAAHPYIKVVPSIGGWTLSDPFFSMASDPEKRAVFVKSAVDFIRQYDFFDGIDIDWEFPGGGGANAALGSAVDFQAYADLMRDLRAELDVLSAETGREYELTSAIGVGPAKIAAVNYAEAQMYMDYIFAMTYDYYGPWNTQLGHHTALYDYPENANEGYASADSIDQLIAAGVPPEKLVLGVAKYGRGWRNVEGGGSSTPLQGVGTYASSGSVNAMQGTWEAGILDYKDIEENYLGGPNGSGINGFSYYYDETAEAAYLWNASTGEFLSFDDARSVRAKGNFAKNRGLGGLFSWEIDADNGTIIDAMTNSLNEE